MDGVLVDNMRIHARAYDIFYERHGVGNRQNVLKELSGLGNDEIMQRLFTPERLAELGGGGAGGVVDVHHDAVEFLIDLFGAPGEAHGVLAHFEAAGGDAAGVRGLAGREENLGVLEVLGRFERSRHVGAFADAHAAAGNQRLGVVELELVLGGAGHGDVGLDQLPRALSFVVLRGRELLGVFADPAAADVLELLDERELFSVDAVLIDDGAVGVGERKHLRTELGRLLAGVLRDVARTGDQHALAVESGIAGFEHFGGEVDRAVTGRFRADQAAAPVQTLAGEHAVIAVDDALVLAEEVADFAAAHADVAGRNVGRGTDVAEEFAHAEQPRLVNCQKRNEQDQHPHPGGNRFFCINTHDRII